MGGEKFVMPAPVTVQSGSPPRGRGKDTYDFYFCSSIGITPAWAGKSLFNEDGKYNR